jgi:hypothetical protein
LFFPALSLLPPNPQTGGKQFWVWTQGSAESFDRR